MWLTAAMSNRVLVTFGRSRGLRQVKVCALLSRNGYSTAPAIVEEREDLYPAIKPLFPPGEWGGMSRKIAWRFHDEGVEINKIPHLKRRLEAMAGDVLHPIYNVHLVDPRPNIPYKLYITKTHVENGLPELYNSCSEELDSKYDQLKSEIQESLLQVHDELQLHQMRRTFVQFRTPYSAQQTLKSLFNRITASLAAEKEHLLRTQMDEDVPIETFWLKNGYSDIIKLGNLHYTEALRLRVTFNATMQIRTEHPLPEVD